MGCLWADGAVPPTQPAAARKLEAGAWTGCGAGREGRIGTSGKKKVMHFVMISTLSYRCLLEITQAAWRNRDCIKDCPAPRLESKKV